MRHLAIWLMVGATAFGCASRTRISSNTGATIYEVSSGRALGTGEGTYEDLQPVWADTQFRAEKKNCDSRTITINRSDDISVFRILAGFFVILPWIWAGDYLPSYGIPLQCEGDDDGKPSPQQQQQQQQQQTVIIGVPGAVAPSVEPPQKNHSDEGCRRDSDCKGDRICKKRECVDPK